MVVVRERESPAVRVVEQSEKRNGELASIPEIAREAEVNYYSLYQEARREAAGKNIHSEKRGRNRLYPRPFLTNLARQLTERLIPPLEEIDESSFFRASDATEAYEIPKEDLLKSLQEVPNKKRRRAWRRNLLSRRGHP